MIKSFSCKIFKEYAIVRLGSSVFLSIFRLESGPDCFKRYNMNLLEGVKENNSFFDSLFGME